MNESRHDLFPECTEDELSWIGELYKCGLTDTYFTDVSFHLDSRSSATATVVSISHRIMEIPIPRPQCIQNKIKNGEKYPSKWKIKIAKKKVKKTKKSSKKSKKVVELDEYVHSNARKYTPPADRQAVKYLLRSSVLFALCFIHCLCVFGVIL